MSNEKKIKRVVEQTDKWLLDRQKKHVKMIEKSIQKLQNNILDSIAKIRTDKTGRIESIKVNLKQAQQVHKDVVRLFEQDFNRPTRRITNDFLNVRRQIEKSFTYLDESARFTGVDRTAMEVLKDGYWRDYLAIGDQQKNKIIQAVYNQVISTEKFSTLVSTIEQALLGSNAVGVTGRPLVQYSRTYANDMIMNYHNEVLLKKAEDTDIKHFLYVGDIIATTRDFCRKRVGKYYTKGQIDSWTYSWKGKSGPAFTNRGGYNCRHHWQPIRPEWVDNKKKLDVADWNLEQRQGG